MTRAVHALHMIVPYKETEKSLSGDFGGVLRAALGSAVSPIADGLIWETGNRDWMIQRGFEPPAPPPTRDASLPDRVVLRASPPEGRRSLSSVAPSSLAHGKINLADILSSEARPALERGTLTHRWMEDIVWIDTGLPSRESLLAASADGDWMAVRPADCVAEFLDSLKVPGIAAMFREAEYRKSVAEVFPKGMRKSILSPEVLLRVERERDFWIIDDEQMVTGSIDRLIVFEREGKPIAAEIIDFKTDRATPGDRARLQELADRYRPQLAAYCRAVARMLQLPAECVVARLLVTQAGEAVSI